MKNFDELICGIKAGYSYFYCQSQEVNKTCRDIKNQLNDYYEQNQNGVKYQASIWDLDIELDPDSLFGKLENPDVEVAPGTIIIAKNYNWFLIDKYEVLDKGKTSWLLNRAELFSNADTRKVLIIVGNDPFEKAIPDILHNEFARIEFDLPNAEEIEKIYEYILTSFKGNPKFKVPDKRTKQRIIAAAKGLTYSEIVKGFSYSIVKNKGVFDPKTVEEIRAEEINSTPGLSIHRYEKTLEDLKGFEIAKEIIEEWINDKYAKGIILLGTAGVGKTHFGQAISGHYNRLCIEIEFAQLMGEGLVGQAEKCMKRALDVIAANANPEAPIIVFIDEIEKGLAGTSGAGNRSGVNDGGTTDRSNAQFLKFLSDGRPPGVYIIATCNDIEKLPAAYVRAERWDCAPLFVNLPNREEQQAILKHYQKTYNIVATPKTMEGWSGAEIKTWCKLAAKKISVGKNANDADELIVPVSKTMENEINYLLRWKEGRTIPASKSAKKTENKRSIEI